MKNVSVARNNRRSSRRSVGVSTSVRIVSPSFDWILNDGAGLPNPSLQRISWKWR